MKLKILVLLLILSSFSAIAQKLKLEQASPFTAVKWENNQPIVQFEGEWYDFEALGHLSKKEILYFCKKTYGSRWQKRFSEDLVEVLKDLKYVPNQQVSLKLAKNGNSKEYIGTFTAENRKSCWEYNISEEKKSSLKNKEKLRLKVSKKQALADLEQFQEILNSRSSYAQLSKYNYVPAIKELARAVSEKQDSVDINELANEISKIMSEIGDRHSSVRSLSLSDEALKTYRLKLPFGLAAINNKVIAIHKTTKGDKYTYYKRKYPYIKNIDNRDVEELINIYNYRHKKAPREAKLARGAEAIERYGALLFKNNETCPKSVQVTFADGKNEIVENIELTYDKKWETTTSKKDVTNANIKETKQFEEIKAGIIGENIAYIKIPSMSSYERNPSLENFLKSTVEGFANTKALIIDVRNNPGGGRDILKTFAGYIVQPQQSPWVANVAYLRTNEAIKGDEKSMSGRYLYSYNSAKFSDDDRKAIDIFNKDFKMKKHFDKSKFSSPFYMVLKAGKTPYVKPVYILVNENSFSAATVFTTAFKGLSNVKIVGVTTDGSSGNSRSTYLDNSKIRVKVSTMLSFQRNGTSLDGNGTKPDIYIPVDIDQVFTGQDTQLEKLVETIKKY